MAANQTHNVKDLANAVRSTLTVSKPTLANSPELQAEFNTWMKNIFLKTFASRMLRTDPTRATAMREMLISENYDFKGEDGQIAEEWIVKEPWPKERLYDPAVLYSDFHVQGEVRARIKARLLGQAAVSTEKAMPVLSKAQQAQTPLVSKDFATVMAENVVLKADLDEAREEVKRLKLDLRLERESNDRLRAQLTKATQESKKEEEQ